jgi:hypothetical protein
VTTVHGADTREKDPRTPLLGTTGDSPTPPPNDFYGKRRSQRLSRHAIKALQRTLTRSRSSGLCWFASSDHPVTIDVGAALVAHVSQINRCGSGWSCPVCAPVVRQRRAVDIDQALNAWLEAGHGALFITLTCSHQSNDELEPRLRAMTEALRDLLQGSAWARYKKRLGYRGSIRAVEVTWGNANGWHPHNHAVLVLDQPATEEQRQALWRWLHDRWSSILVGKGLGSITEAYGVDVRDVSPGVLGEYLAKVEGGWTAGLELARGDIKSSRQGLTPFQLLHEVAATGDAEMRALWHEYEDATFGKRWLRWSPGLRTLLLGDEVEKSDEELAASEGLDVALVRWLVEAGEFGRHGRRGTTGLLLDEVEVAAGIVIGLGVMLGHELRPLAAKGREP